MVVYSCMHVCGLCVYMSGGGVGCVVVCVMRDKWPRKNSDWLVGSERTDAWWPPWDSTLQILRGEVWVSLSFPQALTLLAGISPASGTLASLEAPWGPCARLFRVLPSSEVRARISAWGGDIQTGAPPLTLSMDGHAAQWPEG